ncbi:DUF481 domain-containing protein [Hyphococcus luteus]|uniref:DUF481 domain-containing protein n=1 Tax=Hyphococcus luteus TaxID=2058213 RepID=A0A2S7K3M6_9PROT|nr:DUF481 domain-containing protein [Marinicaulis flavus]PQA87110.1 hypothetical protein CW354_13780 [Marinicaulis flavus]
MPHSRVWFAVVFFCFVGAPAQAGEPQTETKVPADAAAPAGHVTAREELPPGVREMLEAAARTEDAAQVAAVAYAASEVYPEQAEAINQYGDFLRAIISPLGGDIDTLIVQYEPEPDPETPKVKPRTAEQTVKPAPAPEFLGLGDWTGKIGASGLVSSGNSRNSAAGLAVDAKLPDGDFTHNLKLYFDYGRSNGAKTQQRWGGAYKLDYAISEDTFAYSRFSYDEDEFSGFDYRLFGGLGAGHWFIRSEKMALSLEGGPGYQYAPIDDTRETDSHFAFYSAAKFHWVIRDGLKFEQNVDATWTEPTTTLLSNTAVTAAFTDTLSTGISYTYRYETDPPEGRLKTDTTFRVNLNYDF